jgi:hypothetical protein
MPAPATRPKQRVVVDNAARQADQDRCEGCQRRALRRLSDGGGRDFAQVVRRYRREKRVPSIAAVGDGHVITPADNVRRKPKGDVRPYDGTAKLFGPYGESRLIWQSSFMN